jgi:hypothetical protein
MMFLFDSYYYYSQHYFFIQNNLLNEQEHFLFRLCLNYITRLLIWRNLLSIKKLQED